jgi:hypothetical protein
VLPDFFMAQSLIIIMTEHPSSDVDHKHVFTWSSSKSSQFSLQPHWLGSDDKLLGGCSTVLRNHDKISLHGHVVYKQDGHLRFGQVLEMPVHQETRRIVGLLIQQVTPGEIVLPYRFASVIKDDDTTPEFVSFDVSGYFVFSTATLMLSS